MSLHITKLKFGKIKKLLREITSAIFISGPINCARHGIQKRKDHKICWDGILSAHTSHNLGLIFFEIGLGLALGQDRLIGA
jgi:hypothetical protein